MLKKSTRRLKEEIKVAFFREKLTRGNYESCLDDAKVAVLRRHLIAALGVPGDLYEFGVARGGSTCVMSEIVSNAGVGKKIKSFDSFQGFEPEEWQTSVARGEVGATASAAIFADMNQRYVAAKLKRCGLDHPVELIAGFFQRTLPPRLTAGSAIAFCLVDCDLADSIEFCARSIWPYLSPGGCLLFDDYDSPEYGIGVRRVVDAFVGSIEAKAHYLEAGLYAVIR